MIDHTFGKRARDAREAEGMSREEVAEACAALVPPVRHPLTAATLKRIENAKKASTCWARWYRQLQRVFLELR